MTPAGYRRRPQRIAHAAAALAVAVAVVGCSRSPELSLAIREPADRHLLTGIASLNLIATRDGNVLAQSSFAGDATYVSISGVTHGPNAVLTLDGLNATGAVVARGRTCPLDFEAGGMKAPLYFAPTNFFAPTVGAPAAARFDPIAVALADGSVLLAGGSDGSAPLADVELYQSGAGTFAAAPMMLQSARAGAQAVRVPGVGALVSGGVDANGPVAGAEVFDEVQRQFLSLPSDQRLDARVGHRAVLVDDKGTVLIAGGRSAAGAALDTTVFVRVQANGAASISSGPPLATARADHAAVVAGGIAVVIGGFGADGKPLASIESLQPADVGAPAAFVQIASLRAPRADATASVLGDGSILVVGGVDDSGVPRNDAELYSPLALKTRVLELGAHRRGHTATVLPDSSVLIVGGVDELGRPLASVELYNPAAGQFVSERPLGTPRDHHVAVPLCDGTVLVVGGGAGAEIYTPPSS